MSLPRILVPFFAIFALLALFLKLPEIPDFLHLFECKKCAANAPYATLVAAGYFSLLLSGSLLFPNFPSIPLARAGFLWSVLLMAALTFLSYPILCIPCLIAHACNIGIWGLWFLSPLPHYPIQYIGERLCVLFFAPITIIALFSCLNLTFLVYNVKASQRPIGLQAGDAIPSFAIQTIEGKIADSKTKAILNFITPDCPYCQEQLPIIYGLASKGSSYRIINVTTELPSETHETEWVEDKGGTLRSLFKVEGFPTLFVLNSDGKIAKVIAGVSDELQTILQP